MKEDRDLKDLRQKYLNVTEKILPQMAEENSWSITEDHCFQRIVLDNIFEDIWYNHLSKEGDEPAHKQLNKDQIITALDIANVMQRRGREKVEKLNNKSLEYRGKL